VVGGNGFLSKTTTTTRDQIDRQTVQSSELNGDTVNLTAGNDLTVRGSNVAGTGDVALLAGNNLSVETQAERNNELHQKQEKKSGLLSSGGIGFSVGTQSIKTTDTGADATQAGSTVGSVNGNLSLRAGDRLTVSGSDLVAGQDMVLSGKNVDITAVNNRSQQTHEVEQKTSGLTLALSGTVGSALNSAVEASQQAKSSGSSRLQALQGVKAALSGVQAAQAGRLDQAMGADASNTNTVGISLSYGSQSSKSTQYSEQNTAQGSTLNAGRDLSVIATGSGARGTDGDLTVEGSQLKAGNDITLAANRDLYLRSAQNTQLLDGKNESKGGSVGVGIGVGSGGFGLNISASVNRGKGNESGNSTTHSETTVDAGRQVNILTGRDATLTGAQVSGETVKADIGRNLTLTSEQDSDRYDSKQQNASAGGSFSIGSMTGSASVNLSRDKMHSNYDSVVEQTGIFAGKGGYDVTVGEHTQLNGAVIGSTATADKNRLDTGTIGFSDIENRADFEVEHQSVGMSTGGSIGSQFAGNMANGLLVGANRDGHDSSTTHAAVSDGTLIVRDQDRQVQDVNQLSRDVAHANQTLSPIFDKEKEQERLQQAQLIGEIGNQVADIARTEGSIRATNAAKEKLNHVNAQDLQEAKAAWEKANPGKTATLEDINGQIYQTAYNDAMNASGFGTGGQYQQAIQAATAAVQGLAGSDLSAALAGGAAPYVAEVIGHYSGLNDAGKVAAHAVVNAALAAAQGQDALAGAAGAATGELVGMIATEMYGKSADELDETQKQTVYAPATLAAGLSGGLVGDSSASAVAGAQAGKTTVENNYLSDKQKAQRDRELAECETYVCKAQMSAKWTAIDLGQDGSFAAGMIAGVPAGLYDTVDGIVKTASSPLETYEALKSLFNSDDVLGNVSDAVKQSYIDRINRMEDEYQTAGASGSFNAGVEGGKLVTDIVGLMAGTAGVAKLGVAVTEKVVSKVAGKVLSNAKLNIKDLPDINGKLHSSAVRGDATIPVDKIELYLRGKAAGDLDALQQEYNTLKAARRSNQREFAKDPANAKRLTALEKSIHNVERSRGMASELDNAGIPDTTKNNHLIMDKLLDSANTVTPENRTSSVVMQGSNNSVRITATWTILPDGTKRLSTVTTGAFK